MSQQLHFRISSALKNIIGKDLITDEFVAVFELVKNSYDAHATRVVITFGKNSLTIADNGKGMSYTDLKNKWLFVAYSAKKDGTEDIDDSEEIEDYRDKIQNRQYYAGAKGVGRFSCDRLGKNLTLITKKLESNYYEELKIDWDYFDENQQEEFINIPVEYHQLKNYPKPFSFPEKANHGTVLKIENLSNEWDRKNILKLKQSLEKLINPFSEQSEKFSIEIKCPREREGDKEEIKKQEEESKKNNSQLPISERNIVNGVIKNTIVSVISLKTTRIDVQITKKNVYTSIVDRGTDIYKTKEPNLNYPLLEDVKVSLLFLNRSAKKSFKQNMGVELKNYGSILLFKNGFRVYPYGNPGDDSWRLDYRAQQGRSRHLGTRNLFGRVEIKTDNLEEFKEVTSRDGGLIKTKGSQQLMDAFDQVHKRLERYVVGVLWGEGFIREKYFNEREKALEMRQTLKEDKNSDSLLVQDNIGSQLDFLHLIKSLVNNKEIEVLYYNDELINIVSNKINEIKPQFLLDLEDIAKKTNNNELNAKLVEIENEVYKLQKEKNDLELDLEEAAKAQYAAEKERDFTKTQVKYFKSTKTSPEALDVIHSIQLSSTELKVVVNNIVDITSNNKDNQFFKEIDRLRFHIERINKLSAILTKADSKVLSASTSIDIPAYIKEYIDIYKVSISNISYNDNVSKPFIRNISPLDLSVIIDNLVSNSKKAGADQIVVDFNMDRSILCVDFSDNGSGVDNDLIVGNGLFQTGITTTRGGSGIGLSMIKEIMQDNFFGDIIFLGNNIKLKGASFRLRF